MKHLNAPESLIKFEPSIQIYDSMKMYHQQKYKEDPNSSASPKNEQIVDSIIPPRQWTDHLNKLHIQYVSHQQASREDVQELRDNLDRMLQDRQAKKKGTGICGIREELTSQLFDEIIRQVAVDCPERGLLLMRVRDQRRMTLAAYQTIYQSSIGYGIRKQIESQQGCDHIQEEYRDLINKRQQLQSRKGLLLCRKDLLEKQIKENRVIQQEKREEELKFLKLQKENISKFLETIRSQYRSHQTN